MSDTFTLPSKRSSIIRNLQGYHRYTNTANLKRLEKEAQNKAFWIQKTDRITAVYVRALCLAQPISDHQHSRIPTSVFQVRTPKPKMHNHDNYAVLAGKTYLIIEMIPFLVYYSYATKYHLWSLMYNPGYQCSNVYINVEKGTLMNKDIQ